MPRDETPFQDKPCADYGLTSYRYRGTYGWIMIRGVHGAANCLNALQAGAVASSASAAGRFIQGTLVGSAMAKINGAFCRLAPVGALLFGIVEVRYPTFFKSTS